MVRLSVMPRPNPYDALFRKTGSLEEEKETISQISERLMEPLKEESVRPRRPLPIPAGAPRRPSALLYVTASAGVLLITTLFLAGRAGELSLKTRSLEERARALEQTLETAQRENRSLEARVLNMSGALKTAETANRSLREDLQKFQADLDGIREEKVYLEEILINKTKEIEKIKRLPGASADTSEALRQKDEEIARLTERAEILATKLDTLYRAASSRLSEINVAKVALEDTITRARKEIEGEWQSVNLGSIKIDTPARAAAGVAQTASPASSGAPAGSRKSGRVRAVNPDHGFVVIDLGAVDNLRVDSVLEVVRDGRTVATLGILEIRDVMAACTVKNASAGYAPSLNDTVVIRS